MSGVLAIASPIAGKPASPEILVDVARLERKFFELPPGVHDLNQLVCFGISGHRCSSLHASFNESHILTPYVNDLRSVAVDMEAIRAARLNLAVDLLGKRLSAVLGSDQLDPQTGNHNRQS